MNHIGRLKEGVEETTARHLSCLKLLLIVGQLEGHLRLLIMSMLGVVVAVVSWNN